MAIARWKSWWSTASLAASVRGIALSASLALATAYFLGAMNQHYPIRDWLFLSYVEYWLLTLLFNAACLLTGYALLRALIPQGLPERERILFSMAAGLLVFYLGTFLAGLAHLYGAFFFVAWPVVMVSGGGVAVARRARRLARAAGVARALSGRRRSPLAAAIAACGVIALGIVYLGVMTPENVAYDGRWYHLPIAEHYVARRGVEAFAEGWYQGGVSDSLCNWTQAGIRSSKRMAK